MDGGHSDSLITFQMVGNYELYLEPPSLYVQSDGDSLIVFRLGSLNFALADGRQDLIAFNLSTRAIEWRVDDFEPTGDCNVRPPTVYDGKVYVLGKYTLHCFDANTGEQLWVQDEPDGLLGSVSLVIAEGKVITKPSSTRMKAYDPQTGALLWDVNSSVVSPNGSVYYNGHVFVTGAEPDIFVHRISDGKLVYRKSMKDRFGELYKPIAIDPESGLLFTADKKNALCFKINL
jgi:outer membrane protein assembly factor BamB